MAFTRQGEGVGMIFHSIRPYLIDLKLVSPSTQCSLGALWVRFATQFPALG